MTPEEQLIASAAAKPRFDPWLLLLHRHRAGMEQDELARKCGFRVKNGDDFTPNGPLIGRYERGAFKNPRNFHLSKLAKALGIAVDDLLSDGPTRERHAVMAAKWRAASRPELAGWVAREIGKRHDAAQPLLDAVADAGPFASTAGE